MAVGRLRPALRELADEYTTRLSRWAEVRLVELREASRAGASAVQRRREADAIRTRLPAGTLTVALDLGGRAWSSEALAGEVGRWRGTTRGVAFIVGGPEGLDADLLGAADLRWSLGPLTLPHELARIVMLEQLYRAFTILDGLPYHKGSRPAG